MVRKKIKKQFGGKLKAFVSGGGALDQKIGEFLNSIGLTSGRLKTGTPPRIKRSSVRWDLGEEDFGDKNPKPLSYRTKNFKPKDEPCYSFRTTEKTHE